MQNSKVLSIASEFDIPGKVLKAKRFGNGIIHDTFLIETDSKDRYIIQRLHKIFGNSVLEDMEKVTTYLDKHGILTPLLVRTMEGNLVFKADDDRWRMITYIPGKCHERGVSPKLAFSASKLVGIFHNILYKFNYKFKHKLPDFHNTPKRMSNLKRVLDEYRGTNKFSTLEALADKTFKYYESIDKKIDSLPERVIHGDLKINNIRFDTKNNKALCLIDLDTIGRHKIIVDFGIASRTWCNKADEGDIKNSKFDIKIFSNMLAGYLKEAKFLTLEEFFAFSEGIKTMILEVIARFLTDAFEESYFKLIPGKFKSLYDQNRLRAIAQLNLYEDFLKKELEINKLINKYASSHFGWR